MLASSAISFSRNDMLASSAISISWNDLVASSAVVWRITLDQTEHVSEIQLSLTCVLKGTKGQP